MSVNTETASAQGQTAVLEKEGVYASLFEKINLTPASRLGDINDFLDDAALSDAPAGERLTAAMQVFMDCIRKAGQPVEKLDKTLIDHHIAELDYQISCQLDAIMHHEAFQKVESLWRGLKQLVDSTDYSQNVKTEILDVSKDDLRQDFEDAPELIQSGLYWHTYTAEYDTPGGEPIGSVISAYEFDASPQDMALLRNISNVSAAAHMPFIGAVGPAFFLKDSMEEVAAIKDIGNYFDRAEYIKWKSFRDTDDARYIGLVMPRVLGRLPYGPDTVPVRSFNYVEQVKGPDHEKYLWTSASFSFAANMVKSFINNGWCVQIRGPQAGGAVKDLPIHLYDLGTGKPVLRLSDAPGVNGLAQSVRQWQIVEADSYMQAITTDEVLMNGQTDDAGNVLQSETQQAQLIKLASQYSSRLWMVAGDRAHRLYFNMIPADTGSDAKDFCAQDAMGFHRMFNSVSDNIQPGEKLEQCIQDEQQINGAILDSLREEK